MSINNLTEELCGALAQKFVDFLQILKVRDDLNPRFHARQPIGLVRG